VTIAGLGGVPRAGSHGPRHPKAEARSAEHARVAQDHLATVYVCITCRRADAPEAEPRPGALLAEATARAAHSSGIAVRRVRCLANCTRGPSAAIRANGGARSWTYIFGGLDLAAADALIEGARLLAGASDGIMPWRGRPEPLRRGLIARVPPLDFTEDMP
jgi:predicted metal-binding protein